METDIPSSRVGTIASPCQLIVKKLDIHLHLCIHFRILGSQIEIPQENPQVLEYRFWGLMNATSVAMWLTSQRSGAGKTDWDMAIERFLLIW